MLINKINSNQSFTPKFGHYGRNELPAPPTRLELPAAQTIKLIAAPSLKKPFPALPREVKKTVVETTINMSKPEEIQERLYKMVKNGVAQTKKDVKTAIKKAEEEKNAAMKDYEHAIIQGNLLNSRKYAEILKQKRAALKILKTSITDKSTGVRKIKPALLNAENVRDKAAAEYAHALDYYTPAYQAEYKGKLRVKQTAVDNLKEVAAAEELKFHEYEAKRAFDAMNKNRLKEANEKITAQILKLQTEKDAVKNAYVYAIRHGSRAEASKQAEVLKQKRAALSILNNPISQETIKTRPMKKALAQAESRRNSAAKKYEHAVEYYSPKYHDKYLGLYNVAQANVESLKDIALAEELKVKAAKAQKVFEPVKRVRKTRTTTKKMSAEAKVEVILTEMVNAFSDVKKLVATKFKNLLKFKK